MIMAGAAGMVVLAGWPAQGTEPLKDATDCPCLRSGVSFDVSSVEKIILEPEMILEDADRFWREDGAYQLVSKWHDRTNQPLDLDAWRQKIEALSRLPRAEREAHPQLKAARGLSKIEESFVARAVPYLCTFLPPEADLSTTLYFTTEIMAAGFQESGDIVIHILNHDVHNLFVHEIFHRGFVNVYSRSGNPQPETDPIRLIYLALQNEGLATYVGHKGRAQFPQIGQVGRSLTAGDYDMFDNPEEVRRLHTELNRLLHGAQQMESDQLRERGWEIGVRRRAYYIVGAYMAQTIDEALGRQALIKTIKAGPLGFLRTYNGIADEEWKVLEL